jgi:hypothetical protein
VTDRPKQELTKEIDGELHLSTAAVLLIMGDAMHDPDASAESRRRARVLVTELLAVARKHGFTQSDILLTLLDGGERSPRMADIAREAFRNVPHGEISEAIERAQRNRTD